MLKVKKLQINKQVRKLLMSTLLLLQKMLKDKVKIMLLIMITILWTVIPVLWNKLLLTLTQVWNGNAQQQKKLNEIQNPSELKTHMGTTRYSRRFKK